MPLVPKTANVVALVKDVERYILTFDDDSIEAVMRTLGRWAGDPELRFSWYDAAVLSQRVRKIVKSKGGA